MATWCRLEDEIYINSVYDYDPSPHAHPDLVYIQCPDEAQPGDVLHQGILYPSPLYGYGFDTDTLRWNVNLEMAQADKIAAIDKRTDELLALYGMPFGGKRFALTDKARLNYQEVKAGLDEASAFREIGVITDEQFAAFFPVSMVTLDGGSYAFSNPMELKSFFLSLATYQNDPASPYATGRALKARVMASTTPEEVLAIVDDRE